MVRARGNATRSKDLISKGVMLIRKFTPPREKEKSAAHERGETANRLALIIIKAYVLFVTIFVLCSIFNWGNPANSIFGTIHPSILSLVTLILGFYFGKNI